jgi:hypothetical protein
MPVTSLRLVSHRLVGHRQQNAKKSRGRDMTLPSTWRNLNTSTQSAQQAASPLLEAWLSKMADVWKTVVNNAPEQPAQFVFEMTAIVSACVR